jgi:hypothetical protein
MGLHAISILLALVASSALAQAPPGRTSAVNIVAQLYRDFAWEAVVQEPEWHGHGLLEQPRDVLARYFDDTITGLLLADRSCVAKRHAICRLDFSPIWNSQDPGASEVKVSATNDSSIVAVSFRYPSTGELIHLSYRMSRTQRGWRVHDIVYATGKSLLSLLDAGGAR